MSTPHPLPFFKINFSDPIRTFSCDTLTPPPCDICHYCMLLDISKINNLPPPK